MNRRRFLRCTSATAVASLATVYGISQLPISYGQENPPEEFDIGTLQVPVNPDGLMGNGEYDDCNDYMMKGINFQSTQPVELDGHMYGKYSADYTYFGFDFTSDTSQNYGFLELDMDTANKGQIPGVEGYYRLYLYRKSGPFTEVDFAPGGESLAPFPRTPLFKSGLAFGPTQDYYWKSSFGSSAKSSVPHTQIEFQIKTNILRKYLDEGATNKIIWHDIYGFIVDSKIGAIMHSHDGIWVDLKYLDRALPTLGWPELTLAAIVGGTALLTSKLSKKAKLFGNKEVTRRELFRLQSYPKKKSSAMG